MLASRHSEVCPESDYFVDGGLIITTVTHKMNLFMTPFVTFGCYLSRYDKC